MFPEKAERPEKAALDESELSVVALPPTPLKTEKTNSTSSQILPLARLSSSTLPRPATTTSHSNLAQQVLTRNTRPVAEVSPFSPHSPQTGLDDTEDGYQIVPNNSMMDQSHLTPTATSHTPNNTLVASQERPAAPVILRQRSVDLENNNDKPSVSPVKEKLQKMRRSITEPLMQYFHDITLVSPHVSKLTDS